MTTTKKALSKIAQFFERVKPQEQHRTDNRMGLAARIDDAMQEKGLSQKQLAERMGKNHSVITKWLSGKHNFTCDTLSDIESELGVALFQLEDQPVARENYITPKMFFTSHAMIKNLLVEPENSTGIYRTLRPIVFSNSELHLSKQILRG